MEKMTASNGNRSQGLKIDESTLWPLSYICLHVRDGPNSQRFQYFKLFNISPLYSYLYTILIFSNSSFIHQYNIPFLSLKKCFELRVSNIFWASDFSWDLWWPSSLLMRSKKSGDRILNTFVSFSGLASGVCIVWWFVSVKVWVRP